MVYQGILNLLCATGVVICSSSHCLAVDTTTYEVGGVVADLLKSMTCAEVNSAHRIALELQTGQRSKESVTARPIITVQLVHVFLKGYQASAESSFDEALKVFTDYCSQNPTKKFMDAFN